MSSSRRKSSRHSKRTHGSSPSRNNNILVFKLIDPIVQSLLFIFFIYLLDSDTETPYQTILDIIVGWQVLSALANLALNPPDQLKKERIAYLATIAVYMVLAYLFQKSVPEKIVVIKIANNQSLPLYASIIQLGAMIISFWYYVICFREIRAQLTAVTNESA